jgi:hypothetical protein
MKNLLLITLIGLINVYSVFSQDDTTILQIRSDFQKWQPIIDNEIDRGAKYYKYAWGKNYQFNKWVDKMHNIDSLTLSESISIIDKKDLGYLVHVNYCSFSGDWHIMVDYYYNKKELIYFVYWRMNTFYAEEPVTVEKRLYFNNTSIFIKKKVLVGNPKRYWIPIGR